LQFLILAVVCFSLNITLYAQSFSTKGQFWASGLTSNDIPSGQSFLESNIGYIPTFSLFRELDNNRLLDMELSCRLDRMYSGDSLINNIENFHRYWVRYSSDKLEVRLGLQKIIFGPGQVLSSLSWFDTFDLTNPTGQTDGVEAFRLRWFPSNSLSIWSWTILDEYNFLSFGGRAEISSNIGEWGVSVYHDPSDLLQTIGQTSALIGQAHNRFAVDFRYDGFIGFWNESTVILASESEIGLFTVGADYTLPIANGILIMAEYMSISNKFDSEESSQSSTALMVSMPLGMLHQLMFITHVDWDENHTYNYFRWSTTYDNFSLNFVLSINPKRVDYDNIHEGQPNTLTGFGTGLQFMLIYNH
jgi:hypothetical protein